MNDPSKRQNSYPHGLDGPMKAMSPGVVDFLFRQLVAGESPEDVQWRREGTVLGEQQPGAELARRLAETDLESLTPVELFDYVRAAQRLGAWADRLRESAVAQYCSPEASRLPDAPTGRNQGSPARTTGGGRQSGPA
ncbi:hypothetical protein [Arthrobacter sp. AZCC_0090]|uniref:hypothetical protein n=1 Tax=Arthrobacter sp. AZCC_0090 TaxID=2735881 RepID=UPI00184133EE|nr:hypothetical protein [Arthrobacter sp. AZCC_0090]MBB6403330.1 hypothetical protein [Arthrobacter sp. AZCC_0090]